MRAGSKGEGEAGPVFEQFLECVQSLRRGAPASFEFTESLLAFLKELMSSETINSLTDIKTKTSSLERPVCFGCNLQKGQR